ncbi:hypothetical protein Aconfl_00260 [Algoriphagus confluentis]|uniref:Uncharacterized protein n=1 Tax=Algoriphagus confluentis TaxID=1697556 RepID=A0ABQ6PHU1_9BACT|nr:hypothetical protein Aconfl_00260 [Algoriphagus confluentis]
MQKIDFQIIISLSVYHGFAAGIWNVCLMRKLLKKISDGLDLV